MCSFLQTSNELFQFCRHPCSSAHITIAISPVQSTWLWPKVSPLTTNASFVCTNKTISFLPPPPFPFLLSLVSLHLLPPPPFNVSNFMPCSFPLSARLSKADRRIPLLFRVLKPLSCSDSLFYSATLQLWLHTSLGSHCFLTDHCHFPSSSLYILFSPPQHASRLSNQCNYFF